MSSKNWYIIICFFLCSSCLSYYQKFYKFHEHFERGELAEADKVLSNNKKALKSKAKLLYYMNLGVVTSLEGKYEESNHLLEQAYILGEDYLRNYINEAVSFLTNPNFVEYKGENFELIFIHYYKALNYLKLNDVEKALVECKRMDIKLNQLSDKYKSENKYKRDAFIHLLMGIIYEANKDYNNAFISYRNAVDIYQNDYKKLFNLDVPEQLKKDVIRAAYMTGFKDEGQRFEKMFNLIYKPDSKNNGDLVFFWNNGLGPIKAEWGINFIGVKGQGNLLTFENAEMGMSFPFFLDNEEDYNNKGLSQIQVLRVVFPKYIERPPHYNQSELTFNGKVVKPELVENINAIAFKSLNDRMVWELSKSLIRLALKKATEYSLSKENKDLGSAMGIFNALTEKADTRNWQTLPHSIYYSRMSLPSGNQSVKLNFKEDNKGKTTEFNFDIKSQNTSFQTFSSFESSAPARSY